MEITQANHILAIYSPTSENRERGRNKPPDCKTKTAAPTAIGNGGEFGKLTGYSDAEDIKSQHGRNIPDVEAILTDARREIAIAKLTELDFQSHRLGGLVLDGVLEIALAADTLYDAAVSNGLVAAHGDDAIQAILAAGLGGAA